MINVEYDTIMCYLIFHRTNFIFLKALYKKIYNEKIIGLVKK